jgi:Flp pilus assembly pilin Flp
MTGYAVFALFTVLVAVTLVIGALNLGGSLVDLFELIGRLR